MAPKITGFEIRMSVQYVTLALVEPVSFFAPDGEKRAMDVANNYARGWTDRFVQVRALYADGTWFTRLMVYPLGWPKGEEAAA